MKAIVSIHDVSPNTLDRVLSIIDQLPEPCKEHLILLIIPGLNWTEQQISVLKSLQKEGLILAGHGWIHNCETINGFYHHLHSLLISRKAAEHLALSTQQIQELLNNNYMWFVEQGFTPPDYYVPPAWAIGRISKKQLQASQFRFFETTHGIYDAQNNKFTRLPLIGFEADTPFRKHVLRLWNYFNIALAGQRPVRISIHPNDPQLKLRHDMATNMKAVTQTEHYSALNQYNR